MFTKDNVDSFFKRVNKTESCWFWIGYIDQLGYGRVCFNQRQIKTHRASWIIHFGTIPNKLCVLHKCDVRNCVNPNHLWLGTQDDNMKDCAKKGRIVSKGRRGEANSLSKLTNKKVIEMRKFREETGLSYLKIGKIFKISAMTAYRAIVGTSWKDVK